MSADERPRPTRESFETTEDFYLAMLRWERERHGAALAVFEALRERAEQAERELKRERQAAQEWRARYRGVTDPRPDSAHIFRLGDAIDRERTRAEAAEARVAQLEEAIATASERIERDRREPDKVLCDLQSLRRAALSHQPEHPPSPPAAIAEEVSAVREASSEPLTDHEIRRGQEVAELLDHEPPDRGKERR